MNANAANDKIVECFLAIKLMHGLNLTSNAVGARDKVVPPAEMARFDLEYRWRFKRV